MVTQSGADGLPDLATVRAFLATSAQGVSLAAGTWRKSCMVCFMSCCERKEAEAQTTI